MGQLVWMPHLVSIPHLSAHTHPHTPPHTHTPLSGFPITWTVDSTCLYLPPVCMPACLPVGFCLPACLTPHTWQFFTCHHLLFPSLDSFLPTWTSTWTCHLPASHALHFLPATYHVFCLLDLGTGSPSTCHTILPAPPGTCHAWVHCYTLPACLPTYHTTCLALPPRLPTHHPCATPACDPHPHTHPFCPHLPPHTHTFPFCLCLCLFAFYAWVQGWFMAWHYPSPAFS